MLAYDSVSTNACSIRSQEAGQAPAALSPPLRAAQDFMMSSTGAVASLVSPGSVNTASLPCKGSAMRFACAL